MKDWEKLRILRSYAKKKDPEKEDDKDAAGFEDGEDFEVDEPILDLPEGEEGIPEEAKEEALGLALASLIVSVLAENDPDLVMAIWEQLQDMHDKEGEEEKEEEKEKHSYSGPIAGKPGYQLFYSKKKPYVRRWMRVTAAKHVLGAAAPAVGAGVAAGALVHPLLALPAFLAVSAAQSAIGKAHPLGSGYWLKNEDKFLRYVSRRYKLSKNTVAHALSHMAALQTVHHMIRRQAPDRETIATKAKDKFIRGMVEVHRRAAAKLRAES